MLPSDGAEDLVVEARLRLQRLGEVPRPGRGSTAQRWQILADLAASDLSLVRIVEGHLDAVAILAELEGRDAGNDELFGVWGARPEQLHAVRRDTGWVLNGAKPFCSGSTLLDSALVTATTAEGVGLFLIEAAASTRCVGSWRPLGMAATRSETLEFRDVGVGSEAVVGAPNSYVLRPGFAHGGCGVAACWWGGAVALLGDLRSRVADGDRDLGFAAYAAAAAPMDGAGNLLRSAAISIDRDPADGAVALSAAARTRCSTALAARAVLATAATHLGTSVLGTGTPAARRFADLTTYLTQHRETELLDLGRRLESHAWRLDQP